MSYFIDREKIVAQIEGTYCEECETKCNPVKCQPCFVFDFIYSWLGRREDVVRCKYCIHALKDGEEEWCERMPWKALDPSWFCGDGERKEKNDG